MARIAGINIPQNKLVHIGLTYIYGIGNKFSQQICTELEIPKSKRVNELTDDQILKIREYIDGNFVVEGDLRRDNSLSIKRLEKRKIIENRSDDETSTILKRFDTYMNTTEPVLNYYSENPKFKEIDGSLEIDEITRKIDTFINV